jgi:hypothetical protein
MRPKGAFEYGSLAGQKRPDMPVRRQNLVSQQIQAFEGSSAMDHRDINPAL